MATAKDLVDALSDDQLAEHIQNARLARKGASNASTIPLGNAFVTKTYQKDQIEDISCAVTKAREIGVRAPAIRRIVELDEAYVECIQERIRGPTLMDVWHELGFYSTIRLAFQLRSMVGRLRTVISPTAGSLGTGICRSFWLEEYYEMPPRVSASVLTSVINFWHNLVSFRREASKTVVQHKEACTGPLSRRADLAFTHHDLAPRNIILEDGTGDLWLVDWDEAGFYPKYFEYAGMRNFNVPASWGWFGELRWKLFSWIATGWYLRERAMLEEIRRKVTRFPAVRRFNIKAGVTPSERPVND